MHAIVIVFVIAVVLGAFAVQMKMQTIVWQALPEMARGQPRWMVWLSLGLMIAAVIAGLTIGFVYGR